MNGEVQWPARSDLSACDYFLLGYLKRKVYVNHPRAITELKKNVRGEIAAIPVEMTEFAFQSTTMHTDDGNHLNDNIFKK
jgi:hypothetical protein